MDGSALINTVMVNYIAQLHDLPLSAGEIVTMIIIVTAASIGAAGIPSAGPANKIMILQTVGLPITDIGMLFTIEWLVDRYEGEKVHGYLKKHFLKCFYLLKQAQYLLKCSGIHNWNWNNQSFGQKTIGRSI